MYAITPLIAEQQECHHKARAAKPFISTLALWWCFCFLFQYKMTPHIMRSHLYLDKSLITDEMLSNCSLLSFSKSPITSDMASELALP